MATVKASGTLDGTGCYAQVDVSLIKREKTTATLKCVVTSGFTGNGYSSAGYESYTGNFVLSGTGITSKTTNFTAKAKSTGWSGQGQHYSQTFNVTVNISSFDELKLNIKLTYTTSAGGSITASGTLNIPKYVFNTYLKINSLWKNGTFYKKVNGTWKLATVFLKVNGTWKEI